LVFILFVAKVCGFISCAFLPQERPQAPEDDLLSDPDCRTAKSLGNCHAYFGYRFYHYNDNECEGNKHILDNDL